MILLCERCFAQIGDGESALRLAHIADADPDGTVIWRHTYLHTRVCVEPRPAPHERPDPGAWDPTRGIRAFRH